jgi:hypothetical protein
VFTALGAQVTLIDTRDRLPLRRCRTAVRLRQQLERLGLRFLFQAEMLSIRVHGEHVYLS